MNRKFLVGGMCFVFAMLFLSGCGSKDKTNFVSDNFNCTKIEQTNIAVGDLSNDFESNVIFIPYKIKGFNVRQLGFDSGLGFGGVGYLTSYVPDRYTLEKIYCPSSIETINTGYMKYAKNLKVFYCGKVLDLSLLNAQDRSIEFYVPNDKYVEFYNELSESCKKQLRRSNVFFDLNYETENTCYYIDYYPNGNKIENLPPNPERKDHEFIGWYKDSQCTEKWSFEQDNIPIQETEEYQELKLYAKWQ